VKDVIKKFELIVLSNDEESIVPFLKSLSSDDKTALAPSIKTIARNLNKYYKAPNLTPTDDVTKTLILYSASQLILNKFAFVCLSYEEIRRAVEFVSLDEVEDTILPWYQPSWLNRYLLEMVNFEIDYEKMILFSDRGWLTPTKQFIADNAAYGLQKDKHNLKENIWYLFEYYTTIGNDDRWIHRFIHLSKNGDISRDRLLRETLLTSNRGFNKPMTSWFCKLFSALEPTKEELLSLQKELFLALSSPHSKPVGDALKYLKQIAKSNAFYIDRFIENLPLVLSWHIKSIVTSTLTLTDTLIKAYPTHKEALAILATQALAQTDESLQSKTIKLLAKHKLLNNQTILYEISIYSDGLYHSTKQLLPKIEEVTTEEVTIEIIPPQHIREDNRIIYPESFEDMVFFFSQVFEGNNVYDFDLFLYLIPKLYKQVTKENISKIEPIFQRAYKFYRSSQNIDKTVSDIRVIMAQALLYFGMKYLDNKKASEYYNDMYIYEENRSQKYHWYKSKLIDFEFETKSASVFNIHYQLILVTFERIKHNIIYEPLFLTTHSPCWIDADILEKRLENIQNIHPFELQIALSKTIFNEKHLIQSSNKEINTLLSYLQTQEMPLPIESIKNPTYWLTPLLRKNIPNDLEVFAQHFQKEKHDIAFSNILEGTITHRNSKNTTFFSHCVQLIRTLSFDSIYSYTRLFTDDLPFILSLVPNIPNFILEARYKTPQTDFEVMMPMVIEIWGDYGNSNYLFLARTFTDTSKTTRQLSSELWYKATTEGTMNHHLLGKTLGKLEHNEYAPLKRFTDLVVSDMLNISPLHNQALHTLLSSMIAHMSDEPIKGVKKLLEIYLEVLSLTNLEIPQKTRTKLDVWGEVKSLRSVVKKVLG